MGGRIIRSTRGDLNPQPPDYKSGALPLCYRCGLSGSGILLGLLFQIIHSINVALDGFDCDPHRLAPAFGQVPMELVIDDGGLELPGQSAIWQNDVAGGTYRNDLRLGHSVRQSGCG